MSDKWTGRFIALAEHIAGWSKDPSTKVGAVLVSPDRSRIVHGYNGFPRGVGDAEERYNNRDQKYKLTVHAELNAILNAGERLTGWTLYVTPLPPCNECAKAIIQAGIKTVVFQADALDPRLDAWREPWTVSMKMFDEAGVKVIHV